MKRTVMNVYPSRAAAEAALTKLSVRRGCGSARIIKVKGPVKRLYPYAITAHHNCGRLDGPRSHKR